MTMMCSCCRACLNNEAYILDRHVRTGQWTKSNLFAGKVSARPLPKIRVGSPKKDKNASVVVRELFINAETGNDSSDGNFAFTDSELFVYFWILSVILTYKRDFLLLMC